MFSISMQFKCQNSSFSNNSFKHKPRDAVSISLQLQPTGPPKQRQLLKLKILLRIVSSFITTMHTVFVNIINSQQNYVILRKKRLLRH